MLKRAGELLTEAELLARFADIVPPMSRDEALVEASRCLFCFDAPCTRACPTSIDVPRFIRQILHDDVDGSARTILGANIYGGSCARACPVEVLCEGACVDTLIASGPIPIGRLQRYACDSAGDRVRFEPGRSTGRNVAVVGSGPAGLSCAHELRRLGHAVTVHEARPIAGGLARIGIAAYKISTEFALTEIAMIREIGVEIVTNDPVDPGRLRDLLGENGAVFLGHGLGQGPRLGIEGEDLYGMCEAIHFISDTHINSLADCVIDREVIVIGGGNTAIDAATAARRLGADRVTIAYRKDEASMSAYAYEYELAKRDGIRFEWSVVPREIVGRGGAVVGVMFQGRGGLSLIPASLVIRAIGQGPLLDLIEAFPGLGDETGRIVVDRRTGVTPIPGLFAGGDCVSRGGEIVDAVRDGKTAAHGIDRYLATLDRRGA